jgi:hypothetical protein
MKQIWAVVLAFFGMQAFAVENGKKVLTAEQKTKLNETFGEAFVQTLEASFKDDPEGNAGGNAARGRAQGQRGRSGGVDPIE